MISDLASVLLIGSNAGTAGIVPARIMASNNDTRAALGQATETQTGTCLGGGTTKGGRFAPFPGIGKPVNPTMTAGLDTSFLAA